MVLIVIVEPKIEDVLMVVKDRVDPVIDDT